ncbi:hypothetical protein JMUB7514_27830 [Staphylococcus aureus]
MSNEDKLYLTRLTERIKRSNEHKINIEMDDKLGKLIQQKIDKNIDKEIPDFHSTQTMAVSYTHLTLPTTPYV